MKSRPQLILDMGGVLVTNLSPLFWTQLAERTTIAYERLYGHYKQNLSASLWSGEITEAEFWSRLCTEFPSIDTKMARALLDANLTPLPAMAHLAEWSQIADIHILSNHRSEWITPILETVGNHVKNIIVSSEVGNFKPHPSIYEAVSSQIPTDAKVLFVDDQAKNFTEASRLGWDTLLADADGAWLKKVPQLLGE